MVNWTCTSIKQIADNNAQVKYNLALARGQWTSTAIGGRPRCPPAQLRQILGGQGKNAHGGWVENTKSATTVLYLPSQPISSGYTRVHPAGPDIVKSSGDLPISEIGFVFQFMPHISSWLHMLVCLRCCLQQNGGLSISFMCITGYQSRCLQLCVSCSHKLELNSF